MSPMITFSSITATTHNDNDNTSDNLLHVQTVAEEHEYYDAVIFKNNHADTYGASRQVYYNAERNNDDNSAFQANKQVNDGRFMK